MRVLAYYCEADGGEGDFEFDIANIATDKEIVGKAFELAMNKCMRLERVEIVSKELE